MEIKEKAISLLKMTGVYALYLAVLNIVQLIFAFAPNEILDILRTPSNMNEILNVAIMFICSMLPVVIVIKLTCKTSLKKIGIGFSKNWLKHWGMGAALALFSTFTVFIFIVLLGKVQVHINPFSSALLITLFISLICVLLLGYYEEALFRGAIPFVGRGGGHFFCALVSCVFFSLAHMNKSSFDLLSAIFIACMGIALFQLTMMTRDIWMAIGCHTFYDFTFELLGLVPGSGGLVTLEYSNSVFLGEYLGESNLLVVIFIVLQIAIIGFWLIKRNREAER